MLCIDSSCPLCWMASEPHSWFTCIKAIAATSQLQTLDNGAFDHKKRSLITLTMESYRVSEAVLWRQGMGDLSWESQCGSMTFGKCLTWKTPNWGGVS